MTPEFSRPVRLDTLGDAPRPIAISAKSEERLALARRFRLVAIDRLEAEIAVHRSGDTVFAEGRLVGQVTQSCVATGEPLSESVESAFTLRFIPEGEAATAEEVELSDADCDVLTYAGGAIDLGEAVAETMLLALDPFPRAPDADAILKAAGVLGEGETGPFSVLKGLLKK